MFQWMFLLLDSSSKSWNWGNGNSFEIYNCSFVLIELTVRLSGRCWIVERNRVLTVQALGA